MPAPLVLLGIPFIGAALGSLFTASVETLVKYVTKKVAVRVILLGAIIAMLAVFVGVIEGLIAAVVVVFPSEFTGMVQYALPWNTSLCVSSIITIHIARRVYELNVKVVQWTLPGI